MINEFDGDAVGTYDDSIHEPISPRTRNSAARLLITGRECELELAKAAPVSMQKSIRNRVSEMAQKTRRRGTEALPKNDEKWLNFKPRVERNFEKKFEPVLHSERSQHSQELFSQLAAANFNSESIKTLK